MNEIYFVDQIQNLYYGNRLKEIIENFSNQIKEYKEFEDFQTVQLYRGLSLFELSQFEESKECFRSLIDLSKGVKEKKTKQIDLMIYVFFLYTLFDYDSYESEEWNDELLCLLNSYQEQDENNDILKDGIYLIAQAMYKFIDTYRKVSDQECVELLKKALNFDQQYTQDTYNLIGWMYGHKREPKKALEQQLKLYEVNRLYPGLVKYMSQTYQQLGNQQKQEEYLFEAHKQYPQNIICILNIANYYKQQQNYEESKKYFKIAYEANPKLSITIFQYGKFLFEINEQLEGFKLLNQNVENKQQQCEILLFLGTQSELNQIIFQRYFYFQKCIELQPKEGKYYSYMADYQIENGNYEQALTFLKKALNCKLQVSMQVAAYQKKGLCYYRTLKYDKSLKQYLSTLDLNFDINTSQSSHSISYILENQSSITDQRKIELLNSFNGQYLERLNSIIILLKQNKYKFLFTVHPNNNIPEINITLSKILKRNLTLGFIY